MIANVNIIDTLIVALSGLSVLLAVLAVLWPYFERDTMTKRMELVAKERERLRQEDRKRQSGSKNPRDLLSVARPNDIFIQVVDSLGLARRGNTLAAKQLLRMAGMRGNAPLITFLASRAILAVLLPVIVPAFLLTFTTYDLSFIQIALVSVSCLILGFFLPNVYVKNVVAKRQADLQRAWPDALDLLVICVEAGMSIEIAFRKVSEEIAHQSVILSEELSLTTAELSYLPERKTAYENLGLRTGISSIKSTVLGLIQSEVYGTSLANTLRVLSRECRDDRMAAAEKKAAALPPKLTVPMILFFLPVLFVVIIVPAIIQISETL